LLFTSAYRQYSPAVHGYLRAQGVEDAEAVTQDVFLALYPRLDDARGGAEGLRALIFSIAHARIVDHHRRRARSPHVSEYDPADDTRRTASAEESVSGHAGALALLATLPIDYQEVLALRIIADLSVETTAKIMEKSPGAVKQLQRRALSALRGELVTGAEHTP
jgi:RNA polymerase sigma factor (sigma-70 family)